MTAIDSHARIRRDWYRPSLTIAASENDIAELSHAYNFFEMLSETESGRETLRSYFETDDRVNECRTSLFHLWERCLEARAAQ